MTTATEQDVKCPECGGKMWDNRDSKRNPKAPDFKCRDKNCEGVIWPPKNGAAPAPRAAAPASSAKQAFTSGPRIPAIDDEHPELPHEKIDRITAASQSFLQHVIKSELPALADAGIGASDEYVHARVANLLITAEKAGVFQ